eukprot:jgi/Mesen1/6055/ME000309S05194
MAFESPQFQLGLTPNPVLVFHLDALFPYGEGGGEGGTFAGDGFRGWQMTDRGTSRCCERAVVADTLDF